jgi:hypothetical protein
MMALRGEQEARLDRVDALVWALSDLLARKRPMPGMFETRLRLPGVRCARLS